MNYTKGPWVVIPCEKQFVISNEEKWYDLAVVRNISDAFDNEANARLISAAPDLYEALKGMAELLREHAPPMWRTRPEYTDALAALSKAEGK